MRVWRNIGCAAGDALVRPEAVAAGRPRIYIQYEGALRPQPRKDQRTPAKSKIPPTSELSEPGTYERLDVELEAEEELWTDESEADHAGWFCVATDPFPCPADGCPFVALFMTAVHLILVWEHRDDPNLLRHAQRAKEVGRNPRVVTYEPSFGPSASYYAWEAAGRPVHGIKKQT